MAASAADPTAQHLAAIVTSSDDAIISIDLNGIVTSWNRAAEVIFGYTAAEAVGRSILLIIPQDRQDEEEQVLRQIRAGGSVRHFETMRRCKNGSHVQISLTVSPIFDADGVVIGASKIGRDISARKRGEARLADTEAARDDLHRRLLTLVAASSRLLATPNLAAVASCALSIAHDLVAADAYAIWCLQPAAGWRPLAVDGLSEQFAHVISAHGTSELEFTDPLAIEDVLTWPLGAPRRQAYIDEGIASLLVVPLVLRGRRQGALVFYHRMPHRYPDVDVDVARALGNLTAAAMANAEQFDEHQRLMRAGVLADVLRRLSTSLDRQEMLAEVVELLVPRIADWCAVDVIGKDGKAERLAAAHIDKSKIPMVHELKDQHPDIGFAEGSSESVIASGQAVLVPNVTDDMLVRVSHETHLRLLRTVGIVSYICVPLQGQRRVLGTMSLASGESGRHFADDDLSLAHELARRTATAIETAERYQEAQRANRLKDSFLATLSHELRAPLTAILGYAHMLRSEVLPEPRRRPALETIERNAMTVSQMINDLLDVSRIASGKLMLSIQSVSLLKVVRESVESVAPSASDKGLQVHLDSGDDPLPIQGDRSRLQQVFANLLSNAVKFTPKGGHVDVAVTGGRKVATVKVRDSGIGIPPAFRARIFEPFQQVNLKPTPEGGGLGLGLAIVRQIVEMHGGTVAVESEGEGKGSTFTVQLPRAPALP